MMNTSSFSYNPSCFSLEIVKNIFNHKTRRWEGGFLCKFWLGGNSMELFLSAIKKIVNMGGKQFSLLSGILLTPRLRNTLLKLLRQMMVCLLSLICVFSNTTGFDYLRFNHLLQDRSLAGLCTITKLVIWTFVPSWLTLWLEIMAVQVHVTTVPSNSFKTQNRDGDPTSPNLWRKLHISQHDSSTDIRKSNARLVAAVLLLLWKLNKLRARN